MKRILVALILALAMITTCFTGCQITPGTTASVTDTAAAVAVFTIDVNPGIRVYVDEEDNVISIEATNEDGEVVTAELDVEGLDFEAAIELIIDKMEEMGYIRSEESSVLISIEKNGKDIFEKVNEKIEKSFEKHGKKASLIEQELEELDEEMRKELDDLANKYGMSKGKAHLIERIREEFPELSEEELANLSINDLRMMLEDASDDVKGYFKQLGEVVETSYVGKELALAIALEALELAEEDVNRSRVRVDCKEGKMLYEVRIVSGELEYEVIIDAQTGDVLATESKEFEEFDIEAEINDFCDKHGISFDDIKDMMNGIFGEHGNHGGGDHGHGDHQDENEEGAPLTKGELLKGILNALGISEETLKRTEVELHETESGTVYSVSVTLQNGDTYSLVIEAYSGTVIKAKLNGEEIQLSVE